MHLSNFLELQIQESMCPTFDQIYENKMKVKL
jgi:hypothetical protein